MPKMLMAAILCSGLYIAPLLGDTVSAVSTCWQSVHSRQDDNAPANTVPLVPPSQDPFYTPPPDFEQKAPGAILRVRLAPEIVAQAADIGLAVNILYRTTDSRSLPTVAVTTVLQPVIPMLSPSNVGRTALLTYLVAYDSANVDISPSFTLNAEINPEILLALGNGWFVNVPDYEGPLASFTAGAMSGQATLDSIRAVTTLHLLGFNLTPPLEVITNAFWGYSGGALAGEWAAELQSVYAPELKISGAALGGLTPNISTTRVSCNRAICAGLIPQGIVGFATQWPDVQALLLASLNPDGLVHSKERFLSVRNDTTAATMVLFAYNDIDAFFINGSSYFDNPLVQKATDRDGIMGLRGTVPGFPLFVYKSIEDEVSPISETDALVKKYCDEGAQIQYIRNSVGGHLAGRINGQAEALAFLLQIFNGIPQLEGCLVSNTSISVDPLIFTDLTPANYSKLLGM